MKMAKPIIITAGIDTSKDKLDIAVHGGAAGFSTKNDASGWQDVATQLTGAGVTRVGIEATGGYERGVTRYLQKAGFTVVVMQPMQVKAFAKLHLKRAKNDRIDAVLIAACVHVLDADNKLPPDPRFDALADHLTFIEQLEEDIVRIKTRLEHVSDKRLRRIAEADIKRLTKRRTEELQRLLAALRKYKDLAARFDLVESVPSIGTRTALCIVVRMPELGQVSREEIAALAGLAPFVQQSGKRAGQAHIGGGRSRVRKALYIAALPGAFRWSPELKAFYARLLAKGKSHKSALTACARKLLIFANTVVKRGTPWQTKVPAAAVKS
jgi:transposase